MNWKNERKLVKWKNLAEMILAGVAAEKSIKNVADDKLNRETKISLLFYAVFLYLICFHSCINYFGVSTFILQWVSIS